MLYNSEKIMKLLDPTVIGAYKSIEYTNIFNSNVIYLGIFNSKSNSN